jgi:RHS repeat-associated protein
LIYALKIIDFHVKIVVTHSGLRLPVDFNGGLLDEHTRLVHYGDRVYDPLLGQWMVPAWEQLGGEQGITSPFQLFVYRYMNNNPINRHQEMTKFQGERHTLLSVSCWVFRITRSQLSGSMAFKIM